MRFNFGVTAVLSLTALLASARAQETRLSNLAIRAQAGGGETLITGFTISPGPNKTVLIRAIGPTLGSFGVGGVLADPKLELYSGSTKIGENDNWRPVDADAFVSVGAFPLGTNSRDAAMLVELAPGSYSAQVTGLGSGGAGVTLVEVYEVSAGRTRLVNLSTRAHVGTGDNILVPGITISPGAGTRRLLIRAVGPGLAQFGMTGLLNDPKLELYAGNTKTAENDNWGTPIGAGSATAAQMAEAFTAAGAFGVPAGSRDAAILANLAPGGYSLQVSGVGGTTGTALVEVYDLTPPPPTTTLYVAQLRPEAGAGASTGSGYATILVSEDGTAATVNVTFSNLSSAQTAGYLRIGGDPILSLSTGQVSGRPWTFSGTATHSAEAIVSALQNGQLTVGIDSAKFPSGELRGTFIRGAGSQVFTAPAPPPPFATDALTAPSRDDAVRFLTQATFGPTFGEIDSLVAKGITRWLDEQMALPPSLLLTATRADATEFPNPPPPPTIGFIKVSNGRNLRPAWNKIAITAPDQLRQRVAFALSQIFVVSFQDSQLGVRAEAVAKYYDLLVRNAFGNFRQLLDDVTLSPVMGEYLSHVRNQKADPVRGTSPDENYAREVQQLFTIGLVQLQPDGTLLLDSSGLPIPTYDQDIIADTAKILTGWGFANPGNTAFTTTPPSSAPNGEPDDSGYMNPMRYFDAQHDKTEKRIVSLEQAPLEAGARTVVPAGKTGPEDLKILLDTLFNHPNTGPFLARQLIQRLVTSNPSSGYVYRVAQVFADDGTGTRGNLGAVVRAILTDYEARSPAVLNNVGYGKIKEPLIRFIGFLRALGAKAPNGRYLDSWIGDPRGGVYSASGSLNDTNFAVGQGPLSAPSVFNFFSPSFSPPGALAAAGLVAPELEITDAILALRVPNTMVNYLYRNLATYPAAPSPSPWIEFDYAVFLPNARNIPALVDQVNLLFCNNQLSTAARTIITTTLQSVPNSTTDLDRVKTAIHLAVCSPNAAMQR